MLTRLLELLQVAFWFALSWVPIPGVRARAYHSYSLFGAVTWITVPLLRRACRDRFAEGRAAAAWSLGMLGSYAPASGDALLPLLKDPDSSVATSAVQALNYHLRSCSATVLPVCLDTLLISEDTTARTFALHVIAQQGASAALTVPVVAKMLEEDDRELRVAAVTTLGKIGPSAASALPAITSLISENVFQTAEIVRALVNIAPGAQPEVKESIRKQLLFLLMQAHLTRLRPELGKALDAFSFRSAFGFGLAA